MRSSNTKSAAESSAVCQTTTLAPMPGAIKPIRLLLFPQKFRRRGQFQSRTASPDPEGAWLKFCRPFRLRCASPRQARAWNCLGTLTQGGSHCARLPWANYSFRRGLACARSLGPSWAFASGKFLSPLPKRLKSAFGIRVHPCPSVVEILCVFAPWRLCVKNPFAWFTGRGGGRISAHWSATQ